MDTTEIKQETPDTLEVDPTAFSFASDEIKLEFSEIGEPLPFHIIKVEDGEPNVFRMEVPVQAQWIADAAHHQAGPSNVGQLATDLQSSVSPPPNKRMKSEPKGYTRNKQRHRLRLENNESMEIMSSDDDAFSSESDLEYGAVSGSDSECEYISDDDDPLGTGGQGDPKPEGGQVGNVSEDSWWTVHQPEWTTDDTSMKTIEFTKKRELLKPAPKAPYETFRWFLNDQILDTIVNETNKYGTNMLRNQNLGLHSRFRDWKDVTREELITFLALLIHTGTLRTNRLADYWKRDYMFNLNCFSRFMTRNRFMLILNCLNFASPDSDTRKKDNFAKVRPFVNNFNDVMKEIYYPGKELLIAKSMVFWHGNLVRQEYTDHRRHRKGINLTKLAEPNGIVVKFNVYVGNSTENIFRVTIGEIVEELLADMLGCGHSVYMDRYYSSYRLALTLLNGHTYCTGTLNKKTRNNPFREEANTTQAEGLSTTSFFSDGVHVGKWRSRSNKSTLYITTEFNDQIHHIIKKNGTMNQKPKALANFSRFMTCSELQDQLMSYMPCCRKQTRWYKKLFIYTLQIYMNNAFHLFNNFSGIKKRLDFYEYRLAVLKAMLPLAELMPDQPPEPPPGPQPLSHALTRITRTRLREKKEKDGTVRIVKEVMRKECKLCRRIKRRRATVYECAACEGSPPYCTACFCEVHDSTHTPYETPCFDELKTNLGQRPALGPCTVPAVGTLPGDHINLNIPLDN